MRITLVMILAALGFLAAPALAGTPLTDAEMDEVSAGGFFWYAPMVAPTVIVAPTTTVVDDGQHHGWTKSKSAWRSWGGCWYCGGTSGPVVTGPDPTFLNLNIQNTQVNAFLPASSFPATLTGTQSIVAPVVKVPSVSLPGVTFGP